MTNLARADPGRTGVSGVAVQQGVVRVRQQQVGTHHRVLLDDVLAYRLAHRKREEEGLQILAGEAQKHNLGY